MTLPLQGIKVLDLTRWLAGPFCTMILGDFGADVVKVEPIKEGDQTRVFGPFDRGISVFYLSANRNKRSVALNFRDPRARAVLRRMALQADVVVENFKPGTMEEMGLGCESLRAENPRLIYCGVTGMGRDGPYGLWPGVDQIAQGMSGLMSITGHSPDQPTRVGIPIGDLVAGMWAAIGVQAALAQRAQTGRGERVETSLIASLIGILCVQAQRHLNLGEVPKPAGNDHPVISPYGTFRAKDGPFNLGVPNNKMWAAFCDLIGRHDLIEHPDYSENVARVKNRAALSALLNEELASRTRLEWTEALLALGIPAGPIYDLKETFADAQVLHSKLVETIEHPVLGPLKQLANPVKIEAFEGHSVRTPPPLLGEHSEAALVDYGFGPEEIALLRSNGVIAQAENAQRLP